MKSRNVLNDALNSNFVFNLLIIVTSILFCYGCQSPWEIDNPYEKVDWDKYKQYKANFHTHTTCSDGRLNPQTVVDLYSDLGYDILAITDHDKFTHPWTHFSKMEASEKAHGRMVKEPETMPLNFDYEDRNPSNVQLIDVQGCELSLHHHIGSYFSNYTGAKDLKVSLDAVENLKGIGIVNHPGRYNYPAEWYLELFKNHPQLIGEEVYNRGDRYPNMREKWDSLLTISMPTLPVWGFSNDDMHTLEHLGRNWNMLILSELNQLAVKQGMKSGQSYFVYAPEGHDGPNPPIIESIKVDDYKGTIELTASGQDSIRWISNGKIVGKGLKLQLDEVEGLGSYIRGELFGKGGSIASTQPFGLRSR